MFTPAYPKLMQPLKIRDMTVKNRIMSAPNMLFHTVDGRPTDYYIRYIEHKARGGAGIVTLGEAAAIDGGNHTPWMMPIPDNLPLFGEIAAAIHEHGAVANVELTHGGARVKPQYNTTTRLLGPVDSVNENGAKIYGMTIDDMERVANGFADTTEYYLTAGFDTVLLHYAHGWLFSQFFSPISNTRTDEFGGSFENRMRFPLMVLDTVRKRVGNKTPLTLRLSGSERRPDGFTVQDIIGFLVRAQEYVDMAEISVENMTNLFATTYMPHGQNADLAADIKASGKVNIPIYTIGSIVAPDQAEELIASGKCDGVSMSRALIADPYLPKKAAEARSDEIAPCLRCLNCTSSDNMTRHFICSVNPLIAREARHGFGDNMPKASQRKRVLIVGGGPAGMQAAITSAERGHEVVLCEKTGALGGLLRFTETDALKLDLRRFTEYLIRKVNRAGVKILLNTEVTDELIEAVRPDNIIVATGSVPVVPPISGIETARHATDAYFKPESITGEHVVMIGGGLVGAETGMHLISLGKKVTIIEMQSEIITDAVMLYRFGLMQKIGEAGIEVITGATCKEIRGGTVVYDKDGAEQTVTGDAVLYAVGMKSDERAYFDLYSKAPHVTHVGDCKKVGKVDGAIHGGYFAALDVGML